MARNIEQVYTDNPSTTVANNDLVYLGLSPYAATDNSAIKWSDLVTSIIAEGAGGSTTQIQYNNAGALAGDTGFTTDGAGTETIVGQLNVDNLRLDGNTLSTTASDLQLTPFAGTELDINFSSSDIMGVQIRGAGATANPRLLFYRGNTTFLSGLYAGQNDTLTGSGDGIYLRNGVAGGKIFLRDSTGNALTVSAGNTTLSGSLTAGGNISATLSQNATTRVIVSNTNAGTSAIAGHTISNNSGASASINLYSSTYAAVPSFANRLLIGTDSGISNGILMRAPAGGFSVATDGSLSTANLLVNASGDTVLSGSLTAGASSTILKNQNAGTELLISNATGGTASFSGLSWGNNTSSSIMRLFASTYTGVSGWANRLVISQSASIANGILIRSPAGGIQLTADGSTNTANLLVDASGNTVLSGLLTATTGINFGQDTLNYYDEGTFTPAFTFATPGDLALVYTSQVGTYTRIGNRVHVTVSVAVTPTYTSSSGTARITGFPTASASSVNGTFATDASGAAMDWRTGGTSVSVAILASQTYAQIYNSGPDIAGSVLTTANINSGTALVIRFSGSYQV
jgi:hypothetical protein